MVISKHSNIGSDDYVFSGNVANSIDASRNEPIFPVVQRVIFNLVAIEAVDSFCRSDPYKSGRVPMNTLYVIG